VGRQVTVAGVVTAESGRLGTPSLVAIQDASAGIVVRLPDGARPARGTAIELTGVLADPYGQLEVRSLSSLRVIGPTPLPTPVVVEAATLGEPVESLIVTLDGTVKARPSKATSGDFTFDVDTGTGLIRFAADASAGVAAATISAGDRLRLTGVAGQHATKKGALDGYRVWLRDPLDIVRLVGSRPTSSPAPGSSGAPSGSSGPGVISIADAIRARTGTVNVEGTVVADSTLLDATGKRIVIQDRTAAVEVVLSAGSVAARIGSRLRVAGEIGRAYGAPRIRATLVATIPADGIVMPLELRVAPGSAHEWRLVRVRGDVVDVHKLGDTWRAELLVGGQRIPISGLAGARISPTSLVEGRTATIIGIVRRPYPSATDRRFAIVPRRPADITLGSAAEDRSSAPANGPTGSGTGGIAGGAGSISGPAGSSLGASPTDIDIAEVGDHVGALVRVGGLVGELGADGFALDDGTAIGRIVLSGSALDQLALIEAGDPLNAIGIVQERPDPAGVAGAVVMVSDAAGIIRVGDPVADAPSAAPSNPLPGGPAPSAADESATHRASGLLDANLPDLGIAGIVLAALGSLAVTLLRRHRMRRQLAARVARRLNTLVGAPNGASR
jgi:hypothetical protein